MSPAHAQLSSATDEHYSPRDIADRARMVLETIDLDPASDEIGNRIVGATRFIARAEDGLVADWGEAGTIFLNPPGGKRRNLSNTNRFWGRLMTHRQHACFRHAIFLAFNLEALQSTQGWAVPSVGDFPFCVPRKRIRFLDGAGHEETHPTRGNAIAYVPGAVDRRDVFIAAFHPLGAIVNADVEVPTW